MSEEEDKPEAGGPQPVVVNTGGGSAVVGNVRADRDVILGNLVIAEQRAHDVSDVGPNPYLGLRPFTYEDRERFAGRTDSIEEAVRLITGADVDAPDAERTLLFIAGASGSGKSSLAQAGVVPALEGYYRDRGLKPRQVTFHPTQWPLKELTDALRRLDLPYIAHEDRLAAVGTPGAFTAFLSEHTPDTQVNLIVLDQFEELFMQAEAEQRDPVLDVLSDLASFHHIRTHLIATLRSDFLGELFLRPRLYELHKHGLALYAMTEVELKEVITLPLQAAPYAGKSWEPKLVSELASQAAAGATYLPLLQLTLSEIWQRGRLTLAEYRDMGGTLSSAIRDWATAVLTYRDFERKAPSKERGAADRRTMLSLLLDLVQVSDQPGALPDIRQPRERDDLLGSDDKTANARGVLLDELIHARLLSVELRQDDVTGHQYDVVSIIHESLIANWETLRTAIEVQRDTRQQRTHFEQALREWLLTGRADGYLLTGTRLANARALDEEKDISMRHADAREFVERSRALEQENEERGPASLAGSYYRGFLARLYGAFTAGSPVLRDVSEAELPDSERKLTDSERALAQGQGWTPDLGFTLTVVVSEPPLGTTAVEGLLMGPEPVDLGKLLLDGRAPGPRFHRKIRFARLMLASPDGGRDAIIYAVRRVAPNEPFHVFDFPTNLASSPLVVEELEAFRKSGAGRFESPAVQRELENFRLRLARLIEAQTAKIQVKTMRDFEAEAFKPA